MASSELQRAIDWERAFGEANATAGGIEEIRALNDRWFGERQGELPADLEVREVDAGGVPSVWLNLNEAGDDPVVLYVHGGGFILGAAADGFEWLSRLLRITGGRVLGVNYRLAPEHPWPAQVEDVCTAYRWLLAQGVAPGRVAIVGESAGGGLAYAALLALRDAGDPLPGAGALLSPLLDFALTGGSLDANAASDPFVGRAVLEMMVQAALQGQDPAATSPLSADPAGLPPLLIQAGTAEAIMDDGRRLAEKAGAAGVEVTWEPWDDMIHLWHGFPYLPEAIDATEHVARFVAARTAGVNA
jgi:monoterpene epsilon-lactone hydrolase